MSNIRVIAINLPQYHPFKENDEWWGKGFTEWTNVTKSKPRFPGHYQPHLPSDLGFYDLRLPEARQAQADLAKEYGIHGFCYYHYWFNGKQLMERPVNEILSSSKPDFPFMLCWANENWTKVWDGNNKDVIMKQEYSFDDDKKHIRYLIRNYFNDSRYIKVNGKPCFCVYDYSSLPDAKKTIEIWREEAYKEGMELYLCCFESKGNDVINGVNIGFDAAIQFQPHSLIKYYGRCEFFPTKLINAITGILFNKTYLPRLISYKEIVKYESLTDKMGIKYYPCVMPSWDNSPRRKYKFMAFYGANPSIYGQWLKNCITRFKPYSKDENFIFINAWNEWAEGNHLEPDQKWGLEYLTETKKAIDSKNR